MLLLRRHSTFMNFLAVVRIHSTRPDPFRQPLTKISMETVSIFSSYSKWRFEQTAYLRVCYLRLPSPVLLVLFYSQTISNDDLPMCLIYVPFIMVGAHFVFPIKCVLCKSALPYYLPPRKALQIGNILSRAGVTSL